MRKRFTPRSLKYRLSILTMSPFFAGDINVCLSTKDSINRTGSPREILLSDVIRNNNKVAELSDAYRSNHDDDGYTWKRGNICSMLKLLVLLLTGLLSHLIKLLLRLILLLRRNPRGVLEL